MSEKEVHIAKYEDGELKSPIKLSISEKYCTIRIARNMTIKSTDLVNGYISKESNTRE